MSYDEFDHGRCLDRCTVEIDGETFTVSATILASRSNYFYQTFHEAAFVESQTRHVTVKKPDELAISANDFRSFLRRCYVVRDPIDASTYLSLLKCADYFSSDSIIKDAEDFIIASCCPEKWQANKKNEKKPFAISLIAGIEVSFMYNLETAKAHMMKMLGRLRFHTFLKDYPEVMQLQGDIRLWVFDFYAKEIIASQKA